MGMQSAMICEIGNFVFQNQVCIELYGSFEGIAQGSTRQYRTTDITTGISVYFDL